MAVLGVAFLLAASPVAASGSGHGLSRPIKVKTHTHRVHTSIGYYCPANASCAVAPADPRPTPRLKVHARQRLVVVTHARASKLSITVTKPRHNPHNGTITLGHVKARPAGGRGRHWHFRLPQGSRSGTALEISAGYPRGGSFYVAGIRVSESS
jgi:hypothetical protein